MSRWTARESSMAHQAAVLDPNGVVALEVNGIGTFDEETALAERVARLLNEEGAIERGKGTQ